MQKIFLNIRMVLVIMLVSMTAVAQKIEFYTYKLPINILEGGGKVCVKDLSNLGTEEPNFGATYAKYVLMALQNSEIGKVTYVKLNNPWLTTKLYETTGSETDANFVIGGDYKFESASTNSYEEKWIQETAEGVDKKLPICYYNYTSTSSATLEGKIVITKKDGSVLGTIPIGDKKSKSLTKSMEKPAIPEVSTFISELSNSAINRTAYSFSPSLTLEKYKFKNLKTKNKEFKKELKSIEDQIEALLKTNEIAEAGKKYLEIAAKEDGEDVNCNIAACYEMIGNLTKAKEYYLKSADKSGIERINFMIKVRDKLSSLGLPVTENEF